MENIIDYIAAVILFALAAWLFISCYQVAEPGPLAEWNAFYIAEKIYYIFKYGG